MAQGDSADRSQPRWFDAHNHLHDPRLGNATDAIITSQIEAGIAGCVVNATCEEDWPVLAALARKYHGFLYPAFGIHPWKAHTTTQGWQNRLRDLLDELPHAGIGECGIDSRVRAPSMGIQTPVFLSQLAIARETGRPLTIHCLKAWGHLFECFARETPPQRFLLHSFSGSVEVARRLVCLGAYFSASGAFLHDRRRKVLETLRQLPIDRILLETDAPDMAPPAAWLSTPIAPGLNHPANAAPIGRGLAAAWSWTAADFAALTHRNALRFLAVDHSPCEAESFPIAES